MVIRPWSTIFHTFTDLLNVINADGNTVISICTHVITTNLSSRGTVIIGTKRNSWMCLVNILKAPYNVNIVKHDLFPRLGYIIIVIIMTIQTFRGSTMFGSGMS